MEDAAIKWKLLRNLNLEASGGFFKRVLVCSERCVSFSRSNSSWFAS